MSNWKKTHNISVKVGNYTTGNGEVKNKWENIGRVMTSDDGGKMYFLKRTFNPAGVPTNMENDDETLISIFEEKPREGQMSEADFPETPTSPPQPAMATTGESGQMPIF